MQELYLPDRMLPWKGRHPTTCINTLIKYYSSLFKRFENGSDDFARDSISPPHLPHLSLSLSLSLSLALSLSLLLSLSLSLSLSPSLSLSHAHTHPHTHTHTLTGLCPLLIDPLSV